MDEDSASLIVFLAMILPAGLAAGRLAPAPSFLFDALWFSFVFLFTLVTVELGMIVWYARQGDKFDRVTLSLFGLGPLVFGTWPFLAFVVTGLPWDPVVRLAAWFAYVIASIVVLDKWLDRMERLHPALKHRLSARLRRKLETKIR